jgi:phosphoribosylanthranilate isomerase
MSDRVRIKICGLKTPAMAEVAVEAGADFVGLVFAERSPRFVTPIEARAVVEAVSGRAVPVGVFKDATSAEVIRLARESGIATVQLHGRTDGIEPLLAAELAVIRAAGFDPRTIDATLAEADPRWLALLVDTPDASPVGGGTGVAFDWSALRRATQRCEMSVPLILAGGLRAEDVAEAIRSVNPWAVDVSSGVESSRGVKDADKIREFCRAVRSVG